MRRIHVRALLAILALLLVGSVSPVEAQFGGFGKKLKQKAQERIDRRTDEAAGKAVDAADPTDKVGQAAKDNGSAQSADGSADAAEGGAATAEETPVGKGAWLNYDFKPGERPIFVDDLSKDEVGDFPRRLELKEGNFEVVEWQGKRLMRGTAFGGFFINLPETLPERFTMEFDFAGPSGWGQNVVFAGDPDDREHNFVTFGNWNGGIDGEGVRSISEIGRDMKGKLFPIRIMADGKYVKVYMDDKRVANVPNANLGRAKRIYVKVASDEGSPAYFGNFRIMAGGKKLYDALEADGRVATQGIYFDTGSDVIRGESTPTLKEIGTMLKEHPDLKLTIEGHTDNVGSAAANQALSEKRAAAVKAFLVKTYGVDADRLVAKGLGAGKPVAPNTTAEGRQQNRRVELVKM